MLKLWLKSNNIKSFAVVHGSRRHGYCLISEASTECYEVTFLTRAGTFIDARVSAVLIHAL